MKQITQFGLIMVLTLVNVTAYGSGMLIPKDGSIPPLAIKHQRVDIRIKDGVATARIEQVFKNSINRDLEAVYIFPLPANAAIGDFAMIINGKRMSGELVEKGKARKIYQDIVRRMKDPGLLEHMGGNLFRVSVYPVKKLGEQKIELEYSQTLQYESGLYKYVYPLRTGEKASQTLEDFTVSARIQSALPIKNIYSPSHDVGISRKSENQAIIGFEQDRALLDKDFILYYGVSKKDFGLNLLSHTVKGQDGYFMMMLSPKVVPDDDMVMKKDITFVLDTSGSMSGEKIQQARKALEYCVQKLNDGDHFNIIRFSTDVELFKETLVEANKTNIEAATEFINDLDARGGTDINNALKAALEMPYDDKRPSIIAFLTDGKPTIGESDTDVIVTNIEKGNKSKARVFVFGVGETVNTHMLDKISGNNGGLSKYVKPEEDIEVKLSTFSDKMSHPVLSNLKIEVDDIKTRQHHPRELPDLFAGDQITVFGRYKTGGHVAIHLTGEVDGEDREFVYEGTFHKQNTDNAFIPRLWATRRVGYLLDEIRLHGEEAELKNEVLKLSKEYGIMTPYTSYLVLENEEAYKTHDIERPQRHARATASRNAPAAPATAPMFWAQEGKKSSRNRAHGSSALRDAPALTVPMFGGDADDALIAHEAESTASGDKLQTGGSGLVPLKVETPKPMFMGTPRDIKSPNLESRREAAARSRILRADNGAVANTFKRQSGTAAVDMSEAIQKYKTGDRAKDEIETVKHIGGKIFLYIRGRWVDSKYKKTMKSIKVTFAGEKYFQLITEHPELKRYFALGEKVTIVLDDETAVIVE